MIAVDNNNVIQALDPDDLTTPPDGSTTEAKIIQRKKEYDDFDDYLYDNFDKDRADYLANAVWNSYNPLDKAAYYARKAKKITKETFSTLNWDKENLIKIDDYPVEIPESLAENWVDYAGLNDIYKDTIKNYKNYDDWYNKVFMEKYKAYNTFNIRRNLMDKNWDRMKSHSRNPLKKFTDFGKYGTNWLFSLGDRTRMIYKSFLKDPVGTIANDPELREVAKKAAVAYVAPKLAQIATDVDKNLIPPNFRSYPLTEEHALAEKTQKIGDWMIGQRPKIYSINAHHRDIGFHYFNNTYYPPVEYTKHSKILTAAKDALLMSHAMALDYDTAKQKKYEQQYNYKRKEQKRHEEYEKEERRLKRKEEQEKQATFNMFSSPNAVSLNWGNTTFGGGSGGGGSTGGAYSRAWKRGKRGFAGGSYWSYNKRRRNKRYNKYNYMARRRRYVYYY